MSDLQTRKQFKLKPDIKERWITALESGEYKQGTGVLRNENEFCCLGVLCDLHSRETGERWETDEYPSTYYLGEMCFLPLEVADWAFDNFDAEEDDEYNIANIQSVPGFREAHPPSLIAANDTDNYSFKQIAQLIKEYF
jgi:hypothetical protein